MDKEKELLEQYEVSLYTFEPDQWTGRGFYDAETRTIFLNSSLSPAERHRVLLHELGHLEHIGSIYRHSAMRCENEANRHTIHKLLEEELASSYDHQSFNFLHFMKKHKLKIVTDEMMVIDEYFELIG
ncbi:ImmA/IrrE family metallo-endopeptidase [Streptococcus sanguinis]|uniref:ImmA/IrrE family metallo-endopeptidase n=1 Tax=Streptococcus sanguinis TaxID=1305 RepID=A0ABD4VM30_STRSA|nr:ImmA/IrrE family metallo-endopeptidase [Streptococcus sanguinis]MCY7035296.1 ImmA/IrrE family metallo-endopeptidase [Streptococcus sanguinis]